MKTCSSCKTKKPRSEFHKASDRKDGCQRTCKLCVKAKDAIRIVTHKKERNRNNAIWMKNNKEKVKARMVIYREKNREKIIAYRAEYYAKNKESILSIGAKYRAENSEAERLKDRRRRALEQDAEGSHTSQDIAKHFDLQRGMCAYCAVKLKKSGKGKYHIDHIFPLSKGGSDYPHNLQLLCPSCNLRKNAKDPFEWANQNGKLL